jgi:hypothetical protein
MTKITNEPKEFRENIILMFYRMVETYDKKTSNDSEPVKQILSVAKRKILPDLYRAWLSINPQRRIDQKRIKNSIDATLDSEIDIIEIKPDIAPDKEKAKKANSIMQKVFSNQEITLDDFKMICEHFEFDLTKNDYIVDDKLWLKYLTSKGLNK